jgi:hypothetical protein
MQFFLFDLALTFAALLGYRAVEAVVRRGAPVASLARRAPTIHSRTEPQSQQRREAAVVRTATLPQPKPAHKVSQAKIHRLINFW